MNVFVLVEARKLLMGFVRERELAATTVSGVIFIVGADVILLSAEPADNKIAPRHYGLVLLRHRIILTQFETDNCFDVMRLREKIYGSYLGDRVAGQDGEIACKDRGIARHV